MQRQEFFKRSYNQQRLTAICQPLIMTINVNVTFYQIASFLSRIPF
ncbi:hypothetical protein JOC77_001071 [Peribacillus deserti]|uniref:Uncharacterized protein n=1 Tax=Peribacillus deserti TaxID=673318 RepID=A0ABS2QFT2_9BACI|nr:hypothetical protein [Peribacillus deserti]